MKVWTFLILKYAVLVTAQHQSNVQTQSINDRMCTGRMDGIVFPDPDNCDGFVQCQSGDVIRRRCDRGTLFDLNLFYCVASYVVVCGSRREPNVSSERRPNPPGQSNPPTSESHHSICRNRRDGDLIANPNNCRAYIECQQNLRLDRECGNGELFETRAGVCLVGFMVDCGGRNVKTSDVEPRNICFGLPNGTRISNHEECQMYYECRNNQRIDITCPLNQSYDLTSSQCRSSNTVNCGNRRSLNNRNQQNAICQGQRNGRQLGDPNNCRAFIECQGNSLISRTCEGLQLFDTQLESCMPAHTVRCGSRVTPPIEGPQSPEDFFPRCPMTGVSFRSHPHDCQSYFICAGGNMIQHSCSTGIYFNPVTLKCDFVQNVQCRTFSAPSVDAKTV